MDAMRVGSFFNQLLLAGCFVVVCGWQCHAASSLIALEKGIEATAKDPCLEKQ